VKSPSLLDRVSLLIATFLGTGYAPIASGTVATAATIPFYLAISMLPPPAWQPWVQIGAIIVTSLVGIAVSSVAERHFGLHDPSEVVIDEVAGFLITMLFIPISIVTVVAGFFLFRIFDIVKPWPAGPAERLGGGLGIMADDIVCGIYANLILHLLVVFMN
jgi:phosphatidylglycerophosphatase A